MKAQVAVALICLAALAGLAALYFDSPQPSGSLHTTYQHSNKVIDEQSWESEGHKPRNPCPFGCPERNR